MSELTGLKSPFSTLRFTALTTIKTDTSSLRKCSDIELVKGPVNWLYGSVNAYFLSEMITYEELQKVLSFIGYYTHSFRPNYESESHVSHVADYLAFSIIENCSSEIIKIKESYHAKS